VSQSLLVSTSENTIRKFFLTGKQHTLTIFGPPGLAGDAGLVLDGSGNVYVANIFGNAVRKFSPRGKPLGVFASTGLYFPFALAFDSAGYLYVGNIGDSTIRKFSPTGQDLGTFAAPTQCVPESMVFELSGNLLVAGGSSLVCEFSRPVRISAYSPQLG